MSKRLWLVGDSAQDFAVRSTNNSRFRFSSAAGRYLVLCFYGSVAIEKNAKAISFFTSEMRHYFDDKKISFFGISIDRADEEQGRVKEIIPGIRYFWDFERDVSKLYGAMDEGSISADGVITYHSFTLVLDPNLRVVGYIPLTDLDRHNEALRNLLSSLPAVDDYAGVPIVAPVLVIPRVFEPDFCSKLISLYEAHGGRESGSMTEKDGNTVGKIDYNFKRRSDYTIEEEEIRSMMRTRINRRILPEIFKAFQFKATHIERYIVACYDGEHQGFFRPHRDNTTKGTAHRRFACTINLNAEEYEGGNLRFPEFGSRTYRAPTGGAVVFSCSLLHEATPVTKGKRYATLPFLYDTEAAKIRLENEKFLTGEIMNMNKKSEDDYLTGETFPSENEVSSHQ
jgi:predicted 2-oxoglutarate/Fe(II)-dependent dioxygenase YbiX/peroxiredoxin